MRGPEFDGSPLFLNRRGTFCVCDGVKIRQVLRRIIGELGRALENRQIIARPVNVKRFQLFLCLRDGLGACQRHPAVFLVTAIGLHGDARDEGSVAFPQPANRLLAPVENLLILVARMRIATNNDGRFACGSTCFHTMQVSQLVSQCQVESDGQQKTQ